MAELDESLRLLKCSFCGKSQKQVKKLIAGPGVYICDVCIDLCNEIIASDWSRAGGGEGPVSQATASATMTGCDSARPGRPDEVRDGTD